MPADLPQTDQSVAYQMDIGLEVNGLKGNGFLAVPKAAQYQIKLSMPGKPEFLTIKSCARAPVIRNAGSDKYEFTYVPNDLEQEEPCILEFQAMAQKFNYAAARIEFVGQTTTMPARLFCDGNNTTVDGVSVCQSQAGVKARIQFLSPMDSQPDPKCPKLEPVAGREGFAFDLRLGPDLCVYNFKEMAGPGRRHRLSTYGWQQSPLAR